MHDKWTSPLFAAVRTNLLRLGVDPETRILAGVSGGVDSMTMLFILHHLGYRVTAAHVNFNLRGAESINDALFVRKWCMDKGIPHLELQEDTLTYAEKNKLNIQEAAREIRYQWWEHLVHAGQFDIVATAHHLDDTIETVFLNLLRGTGLKGLLGIPPKREMYIRPLLDCQRSAIESFATEHEIPFRTDASNLTDHYRRNKLRLDILPLLQDLHPGFHASMQHTLLRSRLEWEAWELSLDHWSNQYVSFQHDGWIINDAYHTGFILRWLEEKGIPWSLSFDFVTAPEGGSGKYLDHEGLRLSRTSTGFFLEEIQPEVHYIIPHVGTHRIGTMVLTIEAIPGANFQRMTRQAEEYINAKAIQWPLHIRSISPGDSFQPIGMDGKNKKLQDFMVDLKLEKFEKERQLVLCNAHHVLWVIGRRLDHRSRIRPEDQFIYRLIWSPGK